MSPRPRSISQPIVLASIATGLSIALLVGWILLLVRNWDRMSGAPGVSLLVAGIVSLLFIAVTLILFGVFLVREILEVRRQTTFIDSVTHELKSPLASLRLFVETLKRPELSEDQQRSIHNMMSGDIERLASFIEDILIASRLPYESRGHELEEVALAPLIEMSVLATRARYDLAPAAITVAVDADLSVATDQTALETVIKNLLDNAVKYSEERSGVELRAARHGAEVWIEVQDHGIGLDPREVDRIFDRFYRVPDEAVRKRRGTGLGLFVAQSLVKNLGGRIEVSSEGLGKGSRFCVRLPATHP